MKSAIFEKVGDIQIEDIDMPKIQAPDDVIIRVVRTCVCGSDLWAYRGLTEKPEHSEKMSQWTKAVADNSGQRVKFDGYGADTNPLFLSDSEKEYTYEIISGDIFRIEGDNRTKIGNFVDKEDKTVDVKPTEKQIREPLPTEKPTKPVAPVETPETKELKEQVLRMKKLMGL